MIIHDTLNQLGLSARQVDIYLALLREGPSSIRDIATAAGLNRGTTYEELKNLRERSLVSHAPRGKRRHFCAEPPEKLMALANERRANLDNAITTLSTDILPQLADLRADPSFTNVHHYEGDAGIEFVLKDILDVAGGDEDRLYRVYSTRDIRKYLYRPFPNFTRQRVARGIFVRAIAIGEGGDDAPLSERKWIDSPGSGASYVAIYPPRCAMISLVRGDYPTAVVLESDAIARVMMLSFDTLWDRL